jgi:Stage II sporulation protein E (SpoIIE)
MRKLDKWKEQAGYWKSLPPSATILVLGCVFCLFAAFGLLIGIIAVTAITISLALVMALIAGGFAVLWAIAGFRRIIWLLIVLFPLQFAANVVTSSMWSRVRPLTATAADHSALITRLRVEGVLAAVMIMSGYILLLTFVRKEGLRVFGAMTEVRLAGEVHRALVPAFSQKIGDYEIYGSSVPTGQVGGDLVDLIETDGRWTAYIADVSGHGIPAGMMMAMVKSAARMGSPDGKPLSAKLGELNRVFSSVSAPNVFVTFACIAGDNGPNLSFALAGHLPILHYSKREQRVEERSVSNLPLAVVPDAEFAAATLTCEPGDVLAIVTDGFTEVADDRERELGLEPLKATFLQSADVPLAEMTDRLRAAALKHGPQGDDQTVLLIRRASKASA